VRFGYQILPQIVADKPAAPPAKPQVVRYSWRWSETLYGRETEAVAKLEADLARLSKGGAATSAYRSLVDEYGKAVIRRRAIDADVDYNWLWQAAIAANPARFDRENKRIDAVLTGEAFDDTRNSFEPPAFVRIRHSSEHEWLFMVRVYTDITDSAFIHAFKVAIESIWRAHRGADEFRVQLEISELTPGQLFAAPAPGEHIDLKAHIARFPKDGAVLTTGAASLHVTAGTAIALGPHNVAPRVLAHEFGHVLGFPDVYLRGYKDLGAEGYEVRELVADDADIMSAPSSGAVVARHFEALLAARTEQELMAAGLEALYKRGDAAEAAARFRLVLERNPFHYGATLQLAKALDKAGLAAEAVIWWNKILEMAEAAGDLATADSARKRLRN